MPGQNITLETRVEAEDGTATVNDSERTVSHRYKLELSGFEKASRNAKGYFNECKDNSS